MAFRYEDFDLSGIRTYPLASRTEQSANGGFRETGQPRRLIQSHGSTRCRRFSAAPTSGASSTRSSRAQKRDAGIVWGIGAHVIKTGVSPVLIDLMERGYVSALAMNGAGIIHDFEIALSGATSEDVDEALGPGRVRHGRRDRRDAERGNTCRTRRRQRSWPGGGGVPRAAQPAACRAQSCRRRHIASAFRSRCTSPSAPTSSTCIPRRRAPTIGETSLRDFRYFTSCVARLEGGVYLNCGSAVVLPEVFLKAVRSRAKPGRFARRTDDREYRLHADVPTADQCRDATGRWNQRAWNFARRPPRDPDPVDCSGASLKPDSGHA